MSEKRCFACVGSGKIMGGGMIMKDCPHCAGSGFIAIRELDKRSKTYRDAIDKIMKLNEGISRDEAAKMFDDEYEKLEG